jgi:hypothetical protein
MLFGIISIGIIVAFYWHYTTIPELKAKIDYSITKNINAPMPQRKAIDNTGLYSAGID